MTPALRMCSLAPSTSVSNTPPREEKLVSLLGILGREFPCLGVCLRIYGGLFVCAFICWVRLSWGLCTCMEEGGGSLYFFRCCFLAFFLVFECISMSIGEFCGNVFYCPYYHAIFLSLISHSLSTSLFPLVLPLLPPLIPLFLPAIFPPPTACHHPANASSELRPLLLQGRSRSLSPERRTG